MVADKIFDITDKQGVSNTRMLVEGFNNKSMVQIKITTTDLDHHPKDSCDYIQLTPNEALILIDEIHKYLRGSEYHG